MLGFGELWRVGEEGYIEKVLNRYYKFKELYKGKRRIGFRLIFIWYLCEE